MSRVPSQSRIGSWNLGIRKHRDDFAWSTSESTTNVVCISAVDLRWRCAVHARSDAARRIAKTIVEPRPEDAAGKIDIEPAVLDRDLLRAYCG